MELKQIQDLIKFVAKSGVSEVELEQGDFKIIIKSEKEKEQATPVAQTYLMPPQGYVNAPAPQAAAPAAPQPASASTGSEEASAAAPAASNSNVTVIKAPMIGTFYRSSSPEAAPFVKVGDQISKGQVLCIIEAMKLFNEIESEFSGRVVKVLVDDAMPVEYDTPLFEIEQA